MRVAAVLAVAGLLATGQAWAAEPISRQMSCVNNPDGTQTCTATRVVGPAGTSGAGGAGNSNPPTINISPGLLDLLNGALPTTRNTTTPNSNPAPTPSQNSGAAPGAQTASASGGLPLPGGSWSGSCTDPKMFSNLNFHATCKRIDGSTVVAVLPITNCGQPAIVDNQNGTLVCQNYPRRILINGTWLTNCINERYFDTSVTAQCVNNQGGLATSTLDMVSCIDPGQGASTVNGRLVCGSGPKSGGPTAGTSGGNVTSREVASNGPSNGGGKTTAASTDSGPARAISAVSIHTDSRSGSRVVGTVLNDEAVNLDGCDKYWCHLADGRGWISRSYVRFDPAPPVQVAVAPATTRTDTPPAPAPDNTSGAATGSPAPANFAGVWKIVPLVVGQEKAADPFNVVFAQSGATIEGTTDDGVRITGVAAGNNLGAIITRGETKSALSLTLDSSGSTMTGTVAFEGRTTVVWTGTRP